MIRTMNEWLEAEPELTIAEALLAFSEKDEKVNRELGTLKGSEKQQRGLLGYGF